jgi:hypothetical protein
VELDAESANWPCDPSAAARVVLKAVAGSAYVALPGTGEMLHDKGASYRAYLEPNELQDLADALTEILNLQAKYGIKIRFNLVVEATTDGELKPEASNELGNLLKDISKAFD